MTDDKPCPVEGCTNQRYRTRTGIRRYCNTHHLRIKRYGDPHFTKKIHTHPDEESRKEALTASKQRDYQKHSVAYKARAKKWSDENPAKVAASVIRRQRQLKQATPLWLTDQHWSEMDAIYTEARRLSAETGIPHEVDHIVPLRGKGVHGLHVPWNLQVLPMLDNRRKSNLHVIPSHTVQ